MNDELSQGLDAPDRLLAAATDVFERCGVRDGTMAEIAERAGVGRATLYRHFPGKDALLAAVVMNEARVLFAMLDEELAGTDDPDVLLERGLLLTFAHLRSHGLLQRTLREEPQELLPLLTVRAAPLVEAAVEFAAPYLERAMKSARLSPVPPRVAAEWTVRVLLSLLTTPSVTVDLDDPLEVKRFVGFLVQGGTR